MTSGSTGRILIIGGGISGPATALALAKAGIAAQVFEARGPQESGVGAWLTLAPNGVAALKTIDVFDAFAARAFPTDGIAFRNCHGKVIGEIDRLRAGDAIALAAKRSTLHETLREALAERKIPLAFHKRVERIEESDSGVRIRFSDGDSATGDAVIACDGFRSSTRRLLFPDLPPPIFTGVLGCGGFARPQPALPATGRTEMVFGARGFWGVFTTPEAETWWFDSFSWPQEPAPGELAQRSREAWLTTLRDVHTHDPAPVGSVLAAVEGPITTWPMYDMPPLPAWSQNRICLAGDAAHAMPPYAGQGASMALEDAITVARCLRDLPTPQTAFSTFERLRRPRIETVLSEVARNGGDRTISNPVALKMRDTLMPLFLRLGQRRMAGIVGERIDWERRVA